MESKKNNPTTINEYIAQFPHEIQQLLESMRQTIRNAAPDAQESISYQIPTFKLNGNLVHFAVFKNHIGFYPTPAGIDAFKDEMMKYKLSKGTVQFPIDQPLPLDLVRKVVLFRMKQNLEKKLKKK
ncbi:DUF1801 domain-containing protein [candidate division KSB1 bacterium]|nr:DUF1801 domain-containing protein [candidate division KSB1 bacterium]